MGFRAFLLCGRTEEASNTVQNLRKVDFFAPYNWPLYLTILLALPLEKIMGTPLLENANCTALPTSYK